MDKSPGQSSPPWTQPEGGQCAGSPSGPSLNQDQPREEERGCTQWGLSQSPSVTLGKPHSGPWWLTGKESACQCRRFKSLIPKSGKIPWRRNDNPLQYSCLGKSHGRRSLVGCGPWGRKELETTERLHFCFSLSCIGEGNGNPLQCSCLGNPMDRGAWQAIGLSESDTTKQLDNNNNSRPREKGCGLGHRGLLIKPSRTIPWQPRG